MNHSAKNHRGFSIWELLIVIGLMSVLGVISQRLFVGAFRTMQAAHAAETAEMRFDHAMLRLRADCWSARQISADGLSATLTRTGRPAITWRFTTTGDLSRREGDSTVTWPDVSRSARFSVAAPALVVSLPDGFSAHESQIKLVSQLQLAGGGVP
jgi:type II secretory pathway pseudopilin PulG